MYQREVGAEALLLYVYALGLDTSCRDCVIGRDELEMRERHNATLRWRLDTLRVTLFGSAWIWPSSNVPYFFDDVQR